MPERQRLKFGDANFIPQRMRSAAESIRNTIKLSFKDDFVWADSKGFFPEYADKIDRIRQIIRRRQDIFTSREEGSSNGIERITKFSYSLSNAVLINRLYPYSFPQQIDESERQRIQEEAGKMLEETNGAVGKEGKLDEVIFSILDNKLRIEPLRDSVPGQIELGL